MTARITSIRIPNAERERIDALATRVGTTRTRILRVGAELARQLSLVELRRFNAALRDANGAPLSRWDGTQRNRSGRSPKG